MIKSHLNGILLIVLASSICAIVLMYTKGIVTDLQQEENKRMELWAKATRTLSSADTNDSFAMDIIFDIIQQNTTIPIILTDSGNNILLHRNIIESSDSLAVAEILSAKLADMQVNGSHIDIDLGNNEYQRLYYSDSSVITQLAYFPTIQLALIAMFILFSYVVFSRARRTEQDKVWIGLAKETAHQLGTPITALLGWVDLLKTSGIDPNMVADEISYDVSRLKNVADRFSKIGSKTELANLPIYPSIETTVNYLSRRISSKAKLLISPDSEKDIVINHNPILIGWVIENVCKNAVDAVDGNGTITISISTDSRNNAIIDIADNGKGMKRQQSRHAFDTGFTTKRRGWGLGLTLAKRIVKQYHKGKIFVKESELGKGTTIRIVLKNR